jgi:hypothetical protein
VPKKRTTVIQRVINAAASSRARILSALRIKRTASSGEHEGHAALCGEQKEQKEAAEREGGRAGREGGREGGEGGREGGEEGKKEKKKGKKGTK